MTALQPLSWTHIAFRAAALVLALMLPSAAAVAPPPDPSTAGNDSHDPTTDAPYHLDPSDRAEPTGGGNSEPTYENESELPAPDGETLVNSAQDILNDQVIAVIGAPRATDASSHAVPAAFTVNGGYLILTVTTALHRAYPLAVTASVGFNQDVGSLLANASQSASGIAGARTCQEEH